MVRKDLGNGFAIVNNHIILHFNKEVYRKFYPLIHFPDFEIIESNGSNFHYFRDKNNIYLESHMNPFCVLADAHPLDFHLLDFKKGMATSNGTDYIFDQKLPYRFEDVKPLSGLYQQVNNKIYFAYFKEVPAVDTATFEVLYGERIGNMAKDRRNVYFRDKIIPEADAGSFRILEQCINSAYYHEWDHTFYAVDRQFAFYIDTIAKTVKTIRTKSPDRLRFQIKDELGYAIDDDYRYLFGKRKR
ncbi:DKNYY domain-containing protein [Niabella drilacis]|uniref:DKNYY family protein n=1 Tax=Niabella drilacis (strain DSM 25811 / CCM 8410 / CCUG 62505 / LMG 26954 / E90) TaxID=1285928 RepID=A0A1G6TE80_NIADE|nr:DKNYY domain-containing protein [Niabella drilacis]SDD27339.1 DKNYY family protein [Niabella drilacis]